VRASARLRALARTARARRVTLVAASQPEVVSIAVRDLPRSARWGRTAYGLLMTRAGSIGVPFSVRSAGEWDVYLAGEFSPALDLRVDGRELATIEAELGGDSLVPNLTEPARVSLAAGRHVLLITRRNDALAPGDGGAALLDRVYLAPARAPTRTLVRVDARASAGGLCAGAYTWVEALPRGRA
jgi:hypothetical protein